VCDPAQADSVTECGSTWPKMAFVSHPRLVTTALVPSERTLCEGTRGLTGAARKGLQGRRARAYRDSLRGFTGAAGAGPQGRRSGARTVLVGR